MPLFNLDFLVCQVQRKVNFVPLRRKTGATEQKSVFIFGEIV